MEVVVITTSIDNKSLAEKEDVLLWGGVTSGS